MLNYLEKLLNEKTRGEKDEVLYTHWLLVKEYTTKALAIISNIFPHYTIHDRTHSEEILTNIVDILQEETFKSFSSTDLWLLLCAAFYHDMGMAVFASDLDKILKDEDFLLYLQSIQADSNNGLYEQSSYFEVSGNEIIWKDNNVNLEKVDALKFIVAEYVRHNHGERSGNIVAEDPFVSGLIPARLKERLKEICKCHTVSFDKVMELYEVENGLKKDEYGHPRFIACLLRLGDLLDLDSDRVSYIALRTVKTIPNESCFHLKKHKSIYHFRADSELIDISAKCEDPKTVDLIEGWFGWLKNEITNQTNNWNEILPKNLTFVSLPKIRNLEVKLKDYDSPLDDGKTYTKFEIDSQKAIEMLQGANLYTEPFQSIREILQNSVDATYLRIWVENKDSNMTLDEFKKECQKDKYAINISAVIDKKSSDDKNVVWHITISDAGLGMSKEDLKFLYKAGSSFQNKEKQKYLEEMPKYMKPSGTFGIGFQSVFLLTDKVHIKTRKYNSGDVYDLDLYNPTGEDNGTILLKTTKSSDFKIGTEVSFDFVEEKMPEKAPYYDKYNEDKFSNYTVAMYDFVKEKRLDFEFAKIADEIFKFSQASYLRIKLNDNVVDLLPTIEFPHYSETTNLEVSINWMYRGILSIFYRNQPVETVLPFNFHFLDISVNILGGNAKDILTLNRNGINNKYSGKLRKDIVVAVMEYLNKNFSKMTDFQKCDASAFAYLYSDIAGIKDDNSEVFTKWKEYPITVKNADGKEMDSTLGDLIQVNKVKIIYGQICHDYGSRFCLDKDTLIITGSYYSAQDSDKMELLYKAFPQYFKSISYVGNNNVEYLLDKINDLPLIDKNSWKSWFLNVYLEDNSTARGFIPCNPKYIKLAIKEDCKNLSFDNTSYLVVDKYFSYPKMASPYIIERLENGKILKRDEDEKLIDFVFKNRKYENVTKDEIRATYKKFIKNREPVINEINEELKTPK